MDGFQVLVAYWDAELREKWEDCECFDSEEAAQVAAEKKKKEEDVVWVGVYCGKADFLDRPLWEWYFDETTPCSEE